MGNVNIIFAGLHGGQKTWGFIIETPKKVLVWCPTDVYTTTMLNREYHVESNYGQHMKTYPEYYPAE